MRSYSAIFLTPSKSLLVRTAMYKSASALDEALNDSLLRAHDITKIEIEGRDYRAKPVKRGDFSAAQTDYGPPMRLTINGERDPTTSLRTFIETQIDAKRQSYTWLANTPP